MKMINVLDLAQPEAAISACTRAHARVIPLSRQASERVADATKTNLVETHLPRSTLSRVVFLTSLLSYLLTSAVLAYLCGTVLHFAANTVFR